MVTNPSLRPTPTPTQHTLRLCVRSLVLGSMSLTFLFSHKRDDYYLEDVVPTYFDQTLNNYSNEVTFIVGLLGGNHLRVYLHFPSLTGQSLCWVEDNQRAGWSWKWKHDFLVFDGRVQQKIKIHHHKGVGSWRQTLRSKLWTTCKVLLAKRRAPTATLEISTANSTQEENAWFHAMYFIKSLFQRGSERAEDHREDTAIFPAIKASIFPPPRLAGRLVRSREKTEKRGSVALEPSSGVIHVKPQLSVSTD